MGEADYQSIPYHFHYVCCVLVNGCHTNMAIWYNSLEGYLLNKGNGVHRINVRLFATHFSHPNIFVLTFYQGPWTDLGG